MVFGGVLYVQSYRTIRNLDFTKNSFINSISTINEIFENAKSFEQLEQSINTDLEPVTNLIGISSMTKSDIGRSFELLRKWIAAIEPLTKYKFTKNGIESTVSELRFFSNDLLEFFDIVPSLNAETNRLLNSFWLYRLLPIGSLRNILDNVSNLLDIMTKVENNRDQILGILGHFQTQRIAVFNQSIGEARPTGGFLGSYIPIDITQGRVKILGTQSIYGIDQGNNSPIVAHPATWYYGYGFGESSFHGLRNSNFWSCLDTSSRVIRQGFEQQENGYGLSSIILITPQLILDFLPDDYSFKIRDKVINKSNLLDEIEINSGVKYSDASNPKKEIDSFLNPILEDLPKILSTQKPAELFQKLENNLRTRNLQINFKDSKIQNLWNSTGLSGNNTCTNSNKSAFVTPVIANISGDKRNLYTTHNYDITRTENKIKIKYSQKTPPNIESKLIRQYNSKTSFGMVGFTVPETASNLQINSKNSYQLPFLRKYYLLETQQIKNKQPIILPEIQQAINSGYNIADITNDSSKQGFVYNNPDSSKVLGVYVDDSGDFDVDVEFDLNSNWKLDFWKKESAEFIGQVGLNQSLSINGKTVENKDQILIGSGI
jgi:Protein of unknown function (DUF4012)